MTIEKLVAGQKGNVLNSTGSQVRDTVNALVDAVDLIFGSVSESIKALPSNPSDKMQYPVTGYYAGSKVGGGVFVYDASRSKADHNGGTVIAPEAIAVWDGTSANLSQILNWSGTGSGCYVRVGAQNFAYVEWFGAQYVLTSSQSLPVQKCLDSVSVAYCSAGNLRFDSPVYVASEKSFIGAGMSWQGTILRSYNSNSIILAGTAGNPRHTRVKISGFKLISKDTTDRTKFMLDMMRDTSPVPEGEAFMSQISELSFGDVSGAGEQMNGFRIDGTANSISDIRALSINEQSGLESATGIGVFDKGSNKYRNIQCETKSKMILNGSFSTFDGIHFERSALELYSSNFCTISGILMSETDVFLDKKSCNNRLVFNGSNLSTLCDHGMFNDFDGAAVRGADYGATKFGLLGRQGSVKPTAVATAWNSAVKKAYVLPAAGFYFCAVMVRNRIGSLTGVAQSGSFEIFNSTTSTQIASQAFTLPTYGNGSARNNNSTPGECFYFVFQGALNDQVLVRKLTGEDAVCEIVFSRIESANPLMTNGSAWQVSGAPSIPDTFSQKSANVTPVIDAGVYTITVPSGASWFVQQFYRTISAAKLYCAVIQGEWSGDLILSQNTGANTGTYVGNSYAVVNKSIGAKKFGALFFTNIDSQGNSSISFGALANAVTSATVKIDMCAVFPVEI